MYEHNIHGLVLVVIDQSNAKLPFMKSFLILLCKYQRRTVA